MYSVEGDSRTPDSVIDSNHEALLLAASHRIASDDRHQVSTNERDNTQALDITNSLAVINLF